jgi:hypothetical protein
VLSYPESLPTSSPRALPPLAVLALASLASPSPSPSSSKLVLALLALLAPLTRADALCPLLVNNVLFAAVLGWLCPVTRWLETEQLPSPSATATDREKSRANVNSS